MTAPASHERVYRALLRLYPKPFRSRFGDELVQLSGDLLRDAHDGRGGGGGGGSVVVTWLRLLLDIVLTAHGLDSFETEFDRAHEFEVDGVALRVLPLERIIASKRATGRPKDLAAMPALEAAVAAKNSRDSGDR